MRSRTITTFALVSILGLAPLASAQELERAHVRPVHVNTGIDVHNTAITWDGQVLVASVNVQNTLVMMAQTVRPQAITTDANGVAVFGANAFSPQVAFVPSLGIPKNTDSDFSITPTPGVAPNPFASDAQGNQTDGGAYLCYQIFLVWNDTDTGLKGISGQIVVANPLTNQATIQAATFAQGGSSYLLDSNQNQLDGGNPQLTFDGRFLVFNDKKLNSVAYTWNATPASITGWAPPKMLTQLYEDAATLVDGVPLGTRFPLAQKQLASADGSLMSPSSPFYGVYFWMSFDASELTYSAIRQNDKNNTPTSFSMIGRATGWIARELDGPINPDTQTTAHGHFTSPGMTTSFWTPFRFQPGVLPYTGVRPAYFLMGNIGDTDNGQSPDYNEIDVQDALDQDYALVLHMNELVARDSKKGTGTVDTTHTPDTSGNFNTGSLEGARFPLVYSGQDIHPGMVGNCIYFGPNDDVRVKSAPSITVTNQVTAQLFVKRLDASAQSLLQSPGCYSVSIDANGFVNVTITRSDGTQKLSGPVGAAIPVSTDDGDTNGTGWVNVAFSYDGLAGWLTVYVGGVQVFQNQYESLALASPTSDLIVGPGGAGTGGSGKAVLMLDELYLSRVVRSPVEIARNAFVNIAGQAYVASQTPLPLGLSSNDLRIPQGAVQTPAAIALGQQLFFDARLSRNATLSCASCHQPALNLTDGLPIAKGMNGVTLVRNTPSLFNRAFSTLQFFDGRAPQVENQAAMPVENVNELSYSIAELVHFLESSPDYTKSFANAFGSGPISRTQIDEAIAAFERSAMTGGSRVDQFEAGNATALTSDEQKGRIIFRTKGRCVTCHSGSNYTDELFHRTGNTTSDDAGRIAIDGRTADDHAFKTPSLRNLYLSGPYLHDGSVPDLATLVGLYSKGGIPGVPHDRELRPLDLSSKEQGQLVAFLDALQGPTSLIQPPQLPLNPTSHGSTTLANQTFDKDLSGWDAGDNQGATWLAKEKDRTPPANGIALVTPVSQTVPSFIEQAVSISQARTVTATVAALHSEPTDWIPSAWVRIRDASGVWHDAKAWQKVLAFRYGWVQIAADLSPYVGQTITIRVEAHNSALGVDSVVLK